MDPTTQPQAGPEPAQGTPAPGGQQPSGQEPQTFTPDYVRQLRQEAAAHRTEAAALKAEKEERDRQEADAKRTAAEQAEAAKTAEKAARAELARVRAEHAAEKAAIADARKAGFAAPDAVWDLIAARVDYDKDGQPTNLDALLKALAANFPGLLASPAPEAKPAARPGLPTNAARLTPGAEPPKAVDWQHPPTWGEIYRKD